MEFMVPVTMTIQAMYNVECNSWIICFGIFAALSHEMSGIVSLIISVGVFSGMQFYRHQLASSGPLTILGGGLGSILFLFILTVNK